MDDTERSGVEASSAPVEPPRAAGYGFLMVVTVVSVVADLASKGWAKAALSGIDPRHPSPKKLQVWPGHFDFVYALNPGGAWSFLRSVPELFRRPFFLLISAAAIVFIVSVYGRVNQAQRAMRWGLPLALGGAIGNLVDRIRYGSVIDFIDFYIVRGGAERHWPTFNVADIAICIGVALMAFDTLRSGHPHEEPSVAAPPLDAASTEPPPPPSAAPPTGEAPAP